MSKSMEDRDSRHAFGICTPRPPSGSAIRPPGMPQFCDTLPSPGLYSSGATMPPLLPPSLPSSTPLAPVIPPMPAPPAPVLFQPAQPASAPLVPVIQPLPAPSAAVIQPSEVPPMVYTTLPVPPSAITLSPPQALAPIVGPGPGPGTTDSSVVKDTGGQLYQFVTSPSQSVSVGQALPNTPMALTSVAPPKDGQTSAVPGDLTSLVTELESDARLGLDPLLKSPQYQTLAAHADLQKKIFYGAVTLAAILVLMQGGKKKPQTAAS